MTLRFGRAYKREEAVWPLENIGTVASIKKRLPRRLDPLIYPAVAENHDLTKPELQDQSGRSPNSQTPHPPLLMNKAELVEAVRKVLGDISKADAERAVTAVVESIKTGLKKTKNVQLVGFGSFKVVERAARKGVNPKTGEAIRIKKSRTVKFTPGKDLKARI